jgi:hypothetical protein
MEAVLNVYKSTKKQKAQVQTPSPKDKQMERAAM